MKAPIGRREFVKRCVVTGAGIIAAPSLSEALGTSTPQPKFDLYTVVGDRYFDNTLKALDALGGMRKFVQPGKTVGILVNSPMHNPGSFTNPDVALAVVKACLDAGAKQVYALNDISRRYWNRSKLADTMRSAIEQIRYSGETTEVIIDKSVSLRKAEVTKTFLSCDVYINIPMIKDHDGTRFTCNLKNTMGVCSDRTCRRFHYGEDSGLFDFLKGGYENIDLLAQCIADVNLIRQPDLCVVDATEFLVTNGPNGPGELRRPKEVFVTTNCLAADMYAVRHLGLNPSEFACHQSRAAARLWTSEHERDQRPCSLKFIPPAMLNRDCEVDGGPHVLLEYPKIGRSTAQRHANRGKIL